MEVETKQLIRFYTISSELGNMIYTGSTGNTIKHRYSQHKYPSNTSTSKKLFETYGSENCKIIEIFNKVCDKIERNNIEAEYIQQYKNNDKYDCVNIVIPNRTAKEYQTQYYNDNKEKKNNKMI